MQFSTYTEYRSLILKKTPEGKPYFPSRQDIFFSISHSGSYGLCAVSSSLIGVDVQHHRTVSRALPQRVCTEKELASLDFFTLWTLKESYIKLRGKKTLPYSKTEFFVENSSIFCFDSNVFCKSWTPFSDCSVSVCSETNNFPDEIIIT